MDGWIKNHDSKNHVLTKTTGQMIEQNAQDAKNSLSLRESFLRKLK
jgi:hypothetical protein